MKSIILGPNLSRDAGLKTTLVAKALLEKCGRRVVVCPILERGERRKPPESVEIRELASQLPEAELVIAFGGDGTIMHAARAASGASVPVLGVNMGGKGFMAELELDELSLLERVASGKYETERRMMLDFAITRGGEAVHTGFALNDVVVRGTNKVIELTIYGDGHRILSFSGDGTIIATPTGSTAYSMSAGGPIVEPTANNIIITPISAHVLEAKPYVLMSDRLVTVDIGKGKHNPAYLSVDGCDAVRVLIGDVVSVRASERITRFARISDKSFYRRVSEKLGERL